MGFSYGMLFRGLTNAARKVNEMVQEFPPRELTKYLKIKGHNGLVRIDPMTRGP
jgi:hypothetical protein